MLKSIIQIFKPNSSNPCSLMCAFNTINAKHLVKTIQFDTLLYIHTEEIEKEYNEDRIITIPNLEGRILPKQYGANHCLYYLSDPNTPQIKLDIGHSYIFSKNWHNLPECTAIINHEILKIAYPQLDKSIWNKTVIKILQSMHKQAVRYMSNREFSEKFKKKYLEGKIKPIDYIIEHDKNAYTIWRPYITKEIFMELNNQTLIN